MRRLFIIRKDLNLKAGKLAAMVSHCAEAYWLSLIKQSYNNNCKINIDKNIYDNYICDIFTKTICEARNLNQLNKAKEIADELGLVENIDYGFIDDCCKTDLEPEFVDANGIGRCRVDIWFKPLEDEVVHTINKKFKLYRD